MRICAAVTALLLAACSQRVYSPPTQSFGLGPVTSLPARGRSLDAEVASHSTVFDPNVMSGAVRYAQSVDDRTDATVEGTTYVINAPNVSKADPTVYAGRVGVRHSPGEDLAVFAGMGGGYAPAGGGFVSADGGVTVGIHNCVLVPEAQLSGFISQPLAPRPIDVSVDANNRMTDTPSRTVGVSMRAGLRVSLTPAVCRRGEAGTWVYAGLDYTGMRDRDSDDGYVGFGVGVSVPL